MRKPYLKPHIEVVVLEDQEVASMVTTCKTLDPNLTLTPAGECTPEPLTSLDACIEEQFFTQCFSQGS
jgi:hypothetical protein